MHDRGETISSDLFPDRFDGFYFLTANDERENAQRSKHDWDDTLPYFTVLAPQFGWCSENAFRQVSTNTASIVAHLLQAWLCGFLGWGNCKFLKAC